MNENKHKYDGVFKATDAQVSLISRRIVGITDNLFHKLVCINRNHPEEDISLTGLAHAKRNDLKVYQPYQILKASWKSPDGTEVISVFQNGDNLWQVRYQGAGSFNGVFYKALIEALPAINACAAVCFQLLNGAGDQMEGPVLERSVLNAARTLISAPSSNNGLTLIPPLMAAKLAVLPQNVLNEGIKTLRRHLSPQLAA